MKQELYLIFVNSNVSNGLYSVKSSSNGSYVKDGITYHMYAYTNNKDLYKEFKIARDMSKFLVIKKECTKEEYKELKSNDSNMELNYYEYTTKKSIVNIVSTGYEHIDCTQFWFENIMPEEIFQSISLDFIRILKPKYARALGTLGFNTLIRLCESYESAFMYSDLEFSEDMDVLHVSPPEKCKDLYYEYSFDLCPNEFNIFVTIYKELLR